MWISYQRETLTKVLSMTVYNLFETFGLQYGINHSTYMYELSLNLPCLHLHLWELTHRFPLFIG